LHEWREDLVENNCYIQVQIEQLGEMAVV